MTCPLYYHIHKPLPLESTFKNAPKTSYTINIYLKLIDTNINPNTEFELDTFNIDLTIIMLKKVPSKSKL